MANEEKRCEALRLYRAGGYEEIPFSQLEKILTKAEVIRIPGAPEEVAGMVYWRGSLIVVYGFCGKEGAGSRECLALIKGGDGRLYGMTADEIAGGEALDTLYR